MTAALQGPPASGEEALLLSSHKRLGPTMKLCDKATKCTRTIQGSCGEGGRHRLSQPDPCQLCGLGELDSVQPQFPHLSGGGDPPTSPGHCGDCMRQLYRGKSTLRTQQRAQPSCPQKTTTEYTLPFQIKRKSKATSRESHLPVLVSVGINWDPVCDRGGRYVCTPHTGQLLGVFSWRSCRRCHCVC